MILQIPVTSSNTDKSSFQNLKEGIPLCYKVNLLSYNVLATGPKTLQNIIYSYIATVG